MPLTDEQRAQGWIEHDGGECPVAPNDRVKIWVRCNSAPSIGVVGFARNCDWSWEVDSPSSDIIAYRPEPKQ